MLLHRGSPSINCGTNWFTRIFTNETHIGRALKHNVTNLEGGYLLLFPSGLASPKNMLKYMKSGKTVRDKMSYTLLPPAV